MSDVTSAEARETKLWNRAEDDGTPFRSTLSDSFIAVYAGAVNDADGEVAAIGKQHLDRFTFSDMQVRDLADDVQLVTYTADATGTYDGADISGRYRATSIWTRSSGEWKLAYHSEMKAA